MFTPGTVKCAQLGDFINVFTSGTVNCVHLMRYKMRSPLVLFIMAVVKCDHLGM